VYGAVVCSYDAVSLFYLELYVKLSIYLSIYLYLHLCLFLTVSSSLNVVDIHLAVLFVGWTSEFV
jgi:uncharacterized membrane protein YGL010W